MAYFANSTEGSTLDFQCMECIVPDDAPCAVLVAQMTYNYDQCGDGQDKLRACLTTLINDKGECNMKKVLDDINMTGLERRRK